MPTYITNDGGRIHAPVQGRPDRPGRQVGASGPGRRPFGPCVYTRHWFTFYNEVGNRSPFCQRCGSPNPTCVKCNGPTELAGNGTARCKWCGNTPHPDTNPMRRA